MYVIVSLDSPIKLTLYLVLVQVIAHCGSLANYKLSSETERREPRAWRAGAPPVCRERDGCWMDGALDSLPDHQLVLFLGRTELN